MPRNDNFQTIKRRIYSFGLIQKKNVQSLKVPTRIGKFLNKKVS